MWSLKCDGAAAERSGSAGETVAALKRGSPGGRGFGLAPFQPTGRGPWRQAQAKNGSNLAKGRRDAARPIVANSSLWLALLAPVRARWALVSMSTVAGLLRRGQWQGYNKVSPSRRKRRGVGSGSGSGGGGRVG